MTYGPKYDLRAERELVGPKVRVRRGKPVYRKPEDIDGICLHQTACDYGVAAYQLRAAGGDYALALARRSLGTPYHVLSFEDGFFVNSADLLLYTNHGNGLNSHTVGLAVEGMFPFNPPDPQKLLLSWEAAEAARAALQWTVREARKQGIALKYLYAHRQSSSARSNDPGGEVWRVLVDYGRELGLYLRPDYSVGSGQPIPDDWTYGPLYREERS